MSGQLVWASARSSSRAITTPLLEETLILTLAADGTRLSSAQRLQFHFEIDID